MVASFGIAATVFLLALQPALALAPGVSPNSIFARQLDPGSIPSSCLSSGCQALASVATGSCTDLSCLCTPTIANDLKSCIQCAVNAAGSGFTQAEADSAIEQFTDGCTAGGFPISGASSGSSRATTTASGRASATASSKTSAATNTGTGGSANTATATSPLIIPTNTGTTSPPLPGLNSASKTSVGSMCVIAVLGVIALL